MSTELEWKYAVPNPAVLAELPAWEGFAGLFDGPPRQYHMQTVYLDSEYHPPPPDGESDLGGLLQGPPPRRGPCIR